MGQESPSIHPASQPASQPYKPQVIHVYIPNELPLHFTYHTVKTCTFLSCRALYTDVIH